MQRVLDSLRARSVWRRLPRAEAALASSFAMLVAFGGFEGSVRADTRDGASRFGLAWVRDAGADACIDQRSLKLAVQKRLGREVFSDEAERTIEGSVTRRAGSFVVALRVRDANGGALGERQLQLETDDCSKLSEAVVLAVALTIDPNAPSAPDVPTAWNAPAAPTVPTAPGVPAAATPSALNASRERTYSITEAEHRQPCPACAASEGGNGVPVAASLRGSAAVGVLPGLAPGITLAGSVGRSRVRATLSASWFPEQRTDDGRFSFGLSTLNAGACGELLPRGAFGLGLCAELQVGAMHAVVHDLTPLDPGDHLFMALALGPAWSVEVKPGVEVELGGQALVPLLRPEFLVRGEDGTAFQSRPLAALAFVGVGVGAPRAP